MSAGSVASSVSDPRRDQALVTIARWWASVRPCWLRWLASIAARGAAQVAVGAKAAVDWLSSGVLLGCRDLGAIGIRVAS